MARTIEVDADRVYRAVIVKTYAANAEEPERTFRHAEGPYDTAAVARRRATLWKNLAQEQRGWGPSRVDVHVESAVLVWERVE
ncbi:MULTISPECIES: hypothetical protein [unclassified Streptomyces]|uniref:hypothetical protein n=1 Tax=unclassified Streptomyces TaxID=2593676 RepID=UPI00089524F0|nr:MULTISPECIES: hypothetical protein [unclassified Streptomyces]PBC84600.1 hypothetical protein BX261_4594 [Streptomyces sp. 2321.6]SED37421.1 hypothetical protein SAMN05428940_4622 [Streptomyces sp. 2133.1]